MGLGGEFLGVGGAAHEGGGTRYERAVHPVLQTGDGAKGNFHRQKTASSGGLRAKRLRAAEEGATRRQGRRRQGGRKREGRRKTSRRCGSCWTHMSALLRMSINI